MGAPWKRRFRTWKPSFPGSMLIFGGAHLSNSPYSYFYASLPECIPYHYTLLCLSPSRGWKCFFWAGCSQGAMNIHVRDSAARKQQNSNMKESQEIIFLKPELRGFWGDSLTKPPLFPLFPHDFDGSAVLADSSNETPKEKWSAIHELEVLRPSIQCSVWTEPVLQPLVSVDCHGNRKTSWPESRCERGRSTMPSGQNEIQLFSHLCKKCSKPSWFLRKMRFRSLFATFPFLRTGFVVWALARIRQRKICVQLIPG